MKWFVIMCLQLSGDGAVRYWSGTMTATVAPGATPQQVYEYARTQAPAPFSTVGAVIFYSAGPDDIAAPAVTR